MIIKTSRGIFDIALDNTGKTDVGAKINEIINKYADSHGVDLEFLPGTYLIETPIIIDRHQISLSGPAIGLKLSIDGNEGKVTFLAAPECADIIIIGNSERVTPGCTIQRITLCGQNGRLGTRPDINPPQNGIRIKGDARLRNLVVDFCQFAYLTYAILFLREYPKAVIDVLYIVDNWIGECNNGIWMDAGVYGCVISRNGFHDMTETVLHLKGTDGECFRHMKETLIMNNQGWNPGKLVFDIEKFWGGAVSSNVFNFAHENCQAFGKFRSCNKTTINGNSWIADGGECGEGAALGIEDSEHKGTKSIVSFTGVSDSTISNNTFESFNHKAAAIFIGAENGIPSLRNQFVLNRVICHGQKGIAANLTVGSADNLFLDSGIGTLNIIDNGENNKIKIL